MTCEEIIKKWNMGFNKFQITNEYMEEHNKEADAKRDTERISKTKALAYVESIIFKHMVEQMKG